MHYASAQQAGQGQLFAGRKRPKHSQLPHMRALYGMNLLTTKPEEHLLYADTVILDIEKSGSEVLVRFESWDSEVSTLKFSDAKEAFALREKRERVEIGQLFKLKNGRKRRSFLS